MMINYTFDPEQIIDSQDQIAKCASKILEIIIKNKYFTSAHLLYAKIKYLMKERNIVIQYIEGVLEMDPKNIEAYTLYILICLDVKDYPKAKQLINAASIDNPEQSKEHLYFLILKTKCELATGELDKATQTLTSAMKIFDLTLKTDYCNNFSLNHLVLKNTIFYIRSKDKFELYKLNIDILLKAGKTEEAQASINKLIQDFQGTNMEDEILMLNSELALRNGDLKKSVNLLKVNYNLNNMDRKFQQKKRRYLNHLELNLQIFTLKILWIEGYFLIATLRLLRNFLHLIIISYLDML